MNLPLPDTTESMSMRQFQKIINKLAVSKDWNDDQVWLAYGVFKEMGELVSSVEHKESPKKKGLEFADVIFFLFQFMYKVAPEVDLDKALKEKIKLNSKSKKKTYKNGKFVRK